LKETHNEELHNLCSSPSIIRKVKSRRIRWAEHVARMVPKRNALVGNPEGKIPLRRSKRRWEGNIKMDLRKDAVVWAGLIWLRIRASGVPLVNTVINFRIP
jgi:hypothetical protein